MSKASEDFPEPERPVTTVSVWRGMETLMFFRLWVRAPRTAMDLMDTVRSTLYLAHPPAPYGLRRASRRPRWGANTRVEPIRIACGTRRVKQGRLTRPEAGRRMRGNSDQRSRASQRARGASWVDYLKTGTQEWR